mgnify:FL=1
MNEQMTILVVDDEFGFRHDIQEFLSENNFEVLTAETPSKAFEALNANRIDLAILDIRLPEMDGLSALKIIKEQYPDTEVMMISGHGDMDSVIKAMKLGAIDFFPKPFYLKDLLAAILRTKKYIQVTEKLKEMEFNYQKVTRKLNEKTGAGIIGESKAIKHVLDMISKVAWADSTSVLITGESGTGKELVARAIHLMSPRKDNYFYAVNSSAITETLFESEFFGHTKGDFTGANENKSGWIEVANGGSLFLDEIGDLPMSLQIKFLRVLEERKISREGGTREIDINVRIIAATNQDLESLTQTKQFRLDLYHRLNSFIINLPPLRERKEDISLLIHHFVMEFSKKLNKPIKNIEKSAIQLLESYAFPGNIRELRNMVERAVILSDSGIIKPNHFQIPKSGKANIDILDHPEVFDLDTLEKETIIKAIYKANYNKSQAARLLNISFQSLDRRIKKYNLSFERKLI